MDKTIKQLCEEYSITQTELARRYGIPLRSVQDWHAGRRTPPPYVVKMLDELLGRRVFKYNLGDMVIDTNNGDVGEVWARSQNKYGVITYEIAVRPPAQKQGVRWVDQAHLKHKF